MEPCSCLPISFRLGQGSFGQVHVARDRRTGLVRAIKRSQYGSQVDKYLSETVQMEYKVFKATKHVSL